MLLKCSLKKHFLIAHLQNAPQGSLMKCSPSAPSRNSPQVLQKHWVSVVSLQKCMRRWNVTQSMTDCHAFSPSAHLQNAHKALPCKTPTKRSLVKSQWSAPMWNAPQCSKQNASKVVKCSLRGPLQIAPQAPPHKTLSKCLLKKCSPSVYL